MKLYYTPGACSLAVRIVINEIGIKCDYESVNLKTKKTEKEADFSEINAKGSVPTLLLDNNEVLTENAVIQIYLAETYKATELLPPIGDMKRYRVLEWLTYVTTELHKGFGPLFNPAFSEDTKKIVKDLLKHKFDFVERHLAKHKYLVGDHYTLPDGYLFVIITWMAKFNIDLKQWPQLSRYFAELTQRKSIHQSLEQEGLA